LYEKYMVSI